ncbi:MAG TPA: AraC family transcriptional regulator [Lachnospiraceae bacterium]
MEKISNYTDGVGYRCLENLRREWVDFNMCYCGQEDCKAGHRFGPNKRNNYVIHVVWRGKGSLTIGGRTYSLERGDAFVISPKVEAWYEADRENPWSYFWIGYNGTKAEEYTKESGFYEESPVRRVEDVDRLYRYVDQMLINHDLTMASEIKRAGLTLMFFATMIEDYSKVNVTKKKDVSVQDSLYIKSAVDYIDRNYSQKLKIGELADRAGISRSYFSTCFKHVMGCSPQDYIVNLRMEKGSFLLRTTALSINEVASAVGYEDALAFSRIFKSHFGESPKAYRVIKKELLLYDRKGQVKESDL